MNKDIFLSKWKEIGRLPGVTAHQLFMPAGRPFSRDQIKNLDQYRYSAVGIVCYPDSNDNIRFILIERPEYEGAHSGQMAFPGGKVDVTDETILDAAKREVWEEIGVTLSDEALFIEMTEMFIPVSQFIVTPFLFYISDLPALTLSEREVKAIFHVGVDELLTEDSRKTMDMKVGGMKLKNVPYFELQGKVVWGATAVILSELKEMLK